MGKSFPRGAANSNTNTNLTPKSGGAAAKAASALAKQAQQASQQAAAEAAAWTAGAKDTTKKSDAAQKKQAAAAARAERDTLLAAEEAANKSSSARNAKSAVKKVKGSGSSGSSSSAGAGVVVSRAQEIPEWDADPLPTLSARGIDAALSLLSVADTPTDDNAEANKLERHPERRVKAAYAAFEKRRLAEMEDEGNANSNANSNASGKGKSGGGLRRTQRIDLVRREFEKSSENPWNQVYVPVGMAAAGRREVLKGVRREQEGLLRER